MNLSLLLHTLPHLRAKQLIYQVKYRLRKPALRSFSNVHAQPCRIEHPIEKPLALQDDTFTFLNLPSVFTSWNDAERGMLWAYNLNYMDWLLQPQMSAEEGAKWIDKFVREMSTNRVGLDPYPIALRGINWVKFFSLHPEQRTATFDDSLYAQYDLLARKLEYHLLGNHLLEDAYSLLIGAIYFEDAAFYKTASRLLREELCEQVLPDGAHYEQSPMYHCILLDRLLDDYNFSANNVRFDDQIALNAFLKEVAERMLGHLESILWSDKTFPLFNDSAIGIAPEPECIFDYARRLGFSWNAVPLRECGYRHLQSGEMEAFVDVGNITATYQCGHSHADTFNYELRLDGRPLIVETGISTYNKTTRRQYERGTAAHNTVTVGDGNSSEVWSGFRIGKRAKVEILWDEQNKVEAQHDGFGRQAIHRRAFSLDARGFRVDDTLPVQVEGKNYIHLAPLEKIVNCDTKSIETTHARIVLEGAANVETAEKQISCEYNKFQSVKTIIITFKEKLSYTIQLR